jgi:hypothetical protein
MTASTMTAVRLRFLALTPLALLLLCGAALPSDSKGDIHPDFRLTFTERFRFVGWDNAITLDDEAGGATNFTRHRSSLLGQWYPVTGLEFGLKLTNEFRYYLAPASREFDIDEVFIDNLYVKWRPAGFPGTFTLGRQNIILGEGFLVFDGNPLVGSRSQYFNAIRYDHSLGERRSLTLVGAIQEDYDSLLPVFEEQNARLLETDQSLFGLYLQGDAGKNHLEFYFFRMEYSNDAGYGRSGFVYTIGSRAIAPLSKRLTGTAEAAFQSGREHHSSDRQAFGGHGRLEYATGWGRYRPSKLTLGGVYLSGDDPSTREHEGWDPLFARWPKWSESYIYTQIQEGGVAWATNYAAVFGRVEYEFGKDTKFTFDYHHLMAPEAGYFGSQPTDGGSARGELYIGKLTYRVNPRLTGHLLWEGFTPGSYYPAGADSYAWIRAELLLTID